MDGNYIPLFYVDVITFPWPNLFSFYTLIKEDYRQSSCCLFLYYIAKQSSHHCHHQLGCYLNEIFYTKSIKLYNYILLYGLDKIIVSNWTTNNLNSHRMCTVKGDVNTCILNFVMSKSLFQISLSCATHKYVIYFSAVCHIIIFV